MPVESLDTDTARSYEELKRDAVAVLEDAEGDVVSFNAFAAGMEYSPSEIGIEDWDPQDIEGLDHPYAALSPEDARHQQRYWDAAKKRTTDLARSLDYDGVINRGFDGISLQETYEECR